MSAPSSITAAVGTGTSAIASTSRCPSRSRGGNTPATASAARSAFHSGPFRCAVGTRSVRSTAMITSGIFVWEKKRSSVASLSIPVSSSAPAVPPPNAAAEELAEPLLVERPAKPLVDLLRVVAERHMGRDEAADAAPAGVVDGVARLLEHLQHSDVRVSLRAAGAERDAELRPGQVPRDPGQVDVCQREPLLARAVADDALEEVERPGPARVPRLLADEDHLQIAARGGGGEASEQLHLLGVPGQSDDAIHLVEHHAQLLRARGRRESRPSRSRTRARRMPSGRRRTRASDPGKRRGRVEAICAAATSDPTTPVSD